MFQLLALVVFRRQARQAVFRRQARQAVFQLLAELVAWLPWAPGAWPGCHRRPRARSLVWGPRLLAPEASRRLALLVVFQGRVVLLAMVDLAVPWLSLSGG